MAYFGFLIVKSYLNKDKTCLHTPIFHMIAGNRFGIQDVYTYVWGLNSRCSICYKMLIKQKYSLSSKLHMRDVMRLTFVILFKSYTIL